MKTAIEMLRNDTAVWRGDPPSVAAAILQRSTRFTEKKTQFELFKKFATVKPVVLICLTDADHRSKIITTVEIDYQD